jgi:hypothetical protein
MGLRASYGWANSDFDEFDDAEFGHTRLLATFLYNWEHGEWHPYAAIGAGAYFVQGEINEVEGDSDTRGGFHVGGGIDYFTSLTTTIKGEVLYHVVGDDPNVDPSGLTLTVGFKKFF